MPRYIEVFSAARETAEKILALRGGRMRRRIQVTTQGGTTAAVTWTSDTREVRLDMPSLPPDAMLTRVEADRLVAFIAHECCHVLHTDRDAWSRACADGPRVQAWTNALEDVRIEAREIKAGAFPALRTVLGNMANHLHFEALADSHGAAIGADLLNAPYVACILGRVANGYSIPTAGALRASLSVDVAQLIDVALAGLPGCKSTAEVHLLANRLVAMESMLAPKAPPQDAQDGQQGSQDAQTGNGSGSGSGIATDTDLSKTVNAIAERNGTTTVNGHGVFPTSHLSAVRNRVTSTAERANAPATENLMAGQVLTQLLPRNAVLHGQIARLLVSEEMRQTTHRETSGRLDRRALARMRTGALDVYTRREEAPGIDTAVLILIDGSSSMNEGRYPYGQSRMAIAQCAAWHIARAAEAANGKVAIVAFHAGDTDPRTALLTVVKPWEVRTDDRAAAITAIEGKNTTPLSPAIIECSRMLAAVNATRHILLCLTDGECNYRAAGVRAACAIAQDHGVEPVGIGINCDQVVAAFPPRYSVNVKDLAQLAATGLGVLVAMLEDANPMAAD